MKRKYDFETLTVQCKRQKWKQLHVACLKIHCFIIYISEVRRELMKFGSLYDATSCRMVHSVLTVLRVSQEKWTRCREVQRACQYLPCVRCVNLSVQIKIITEPQTFIGPIQCSGSQLRVMTPKWYTIILGSWPQNDIWLLTFKSDDKHFLCSIFHFWLRVVHPIIGYFGIK